MLRQLPFRVLIIEGRMIIAADISLQLSKLGYTIIGILPNFEELCNVIECTYPDVIVTNIGVKGKIDRLKMASILLEAHQIVVIFISANTSQEIFEVIINKPSFTFITKPFDAQDLKRGIEIALKRMITHGQK